MTRRSLVDFEDSTDEILQEAKQHRPEVYPAHEESMTVGNQEQVVAETQQAGGSMQGWRLGPSRYDVIAVAGFAVTVFAGALALFNSPKGRLLSAVIMIVGLLLIFGLFPSTKSRG
jgi:hypothetical protein